MNTSDFLLANGRSDAVAITEPGGSYTYGELKIAAARLAGELRALGLEPRSRVGIVGANSLFWAASYLAIMKSGFVAVPFSSMLPPEEVRRNAEWVECGAVLMDRRQQRAFASAFPEGMRVITDAALGEHGEQYWPERQDFDPGLDAALMFTSGTTSRPKAVRVTHGNIQANTDSIISYLGLRSDDCMLVILPFFYCFGTSLLHSHLRVGGRLALCNSFTFPETAIDMMERERCTGFAGVPSSFQLLLRISSFKRRELPLLRHIQQAGGKLQPVLIEELVASKPSVRLFVMYGQTEATARLSYLPPEKVLEKLGSIGSGIPGVELRVLGEDGKAVKPGEVGEIYARGGNISPGYYKDPEGSAAKFLGGALKTGDLATVDQDGYIFVVDRKDDFIKSWGYRISSQDIESCAMRMADLVSAAAIGVPDLEAGEAIVLFVVLRPGSEATPDDILAHCREGLAKHMVPRAVRIIKELPLNTNGKIQKSELRKLAEI
jgi:long-chain acyl-CoA synthetase